MESGTGLGAPLKLGVQLTSAQDYVILFYFASEAYLQRVQSANFPHREGEIDGQLRMVMKTYENAEQHCASIATGMISAFGGTNMQKYAEEDAASLSAKMTEFSNTFENQIRPGLEGFGCTVDWVEVTAASETYSFTLDDGSLWTISVMTAVRGYQYGIPYGDVQILWDVPEYYLMVCPEVVYERAHSTIFPVFVENTAVSDTFINLQDQLTEQIASDTINAWNSAVAASNAYAAAMNAFMTQSVNDYLAAPTYSTADRFSDYIFDQNTYTNSDGYSIKVSTAYDYVWDNGSGDFGFSTSAFDVPAGAELLYPSY